MTKDYSNLVKEVYRESEDAQAEIRQTQYKASLMTSLPVSPEQATKQYQLSKQTGIPVGIVRANENEIAQRTELATFEDSDFVNNFPKVVAQLSRPEVAGAIKDDIDSLSTFEKISRSTQEKFQQSALQDETVDLRLRRMGFEATGNEKYKLRPSEEALISEFDRAQPKDYGLGFFSSIVSETGSGLRTVFGVAKRAGLKAIGAIGLGATIGGTAAALTTKTVPAGVVAGARVGLTYGGGAASGYEMAKLETAGAYDELRNVVDETGKPLEKDVAAGAALATGVINGAIELIPAKIGLDTIKKAFSREGAKQLVKNPVAREYLRNIGKGLLAEGATEGTQELFNIVLGEAAKAVSSGDFKVVGMKDANDTEGLLKFLSDSSQRIGTSAAAGAASGVGFSVIGGGAIAAKRIYDNKKANEREQEIITQIIDTSKQSKVLQRDSALFKDVTENTLGETNIYIPAEQIQTYFQEKPDQAASFFKNIPDAQEQIQEALDTGGNLVIKGNDLATAIKENPELETLKEFMKLSPESFNALEAQDEFLTRVVPEQVALEEEAISNAERDAIKRNIRQQISNIIPTKEQEDYIKLLESYYDTRAKKYGSEAAKKILETYLGQLEIGQKKFQKPSPFKMVEDLDLMIDKARKPIKQPKATKPLLKTLKEMGGVRIGSNLAGELNAMGINSKTAPALFRKENGLDDIDNIPLSEFQTKFPNVQAIADKTGSYVDRNYLLNLLSEEQFGKDITQIKTPEQEQIDNFLQGLSEDGIDLNASNEEIKRRIKEYQGRTFSQTQDQQDVKGQTQFIGQKPVITLFEKADRSTLLHELGHTFLQIEADVAKLPDMPADFKKDWATLEKWLGVKDGVITREAHEKFARGFEAYVREGKAPSLELRSAFRRFKAWLVKVYQDVLNLNVKLNDDIRGYFDRLLATDEVIESQKNNPIFATDKNVLELLTKKEREDYIKITDNTKEKTKEQLLKKAFKQSEFKNKKSYKEALEEVKQEIQDELNQDKTFKVLNYLKTGKINGEEQPKKIKLNRQDVKENYDGEFIKYLPKEIFGKDGVEVALVADEFGFKSGSEMLYSIANAPDYKARVEELADQEMIRRYGDLLKDGTIEREALEMAENEARANKIVYELNAVNRKVRTITETKDAYKQKAKEIIEGKNLIEATDTNRYYINELKAAREAGIALGKKDYEKAVDWKKKQLLNHFLFRESKALRDEIKSSKKRYDRYKKKPAKGKVVIDEDYRLRIANLLQDFGLANKGVDYVKTNIEELDAWKRGKQEEGVLGLIEFPEIADFQEKPFNQLTVEQYRTLDNAIENLAHIGRQERLIIVDGVKRSIDQFVDSVQENLNKLPDKQVKIGELSKKEKRKKFFDSAVSFLDKVQTTVFKIDDKKELGVFYQGFVKGLTEGERNKDDLSRESYAKLDEIFKKHYKKGIIPSKETYFETPNQSLTKKSVIALALNWGNETNRKRIRDGYKWTDQQVNEILTTLDKNDLAFVQDIWDFINSYWPNLESIDKKIYGIAPKKEAASPITVKTNDGDVNLRGGYYPISYTEDTDFLETTAKELNSFFVNNQSSNLNVNKSYTKERAAGRVQGKVDLTLSPLFQHLENVVNDIALKEPAWNAYKLVKNNKLKTQLKNKIGNADYQSLVSWVKDVYGKTSVQEGYLNRLARRTRGATVLYQMGFKLSTVIIQATGLLNSTVKLGYGNMGYGIWKALGNGNPISINKAIREAEAKSKILKNRAKSFNRDVSEIMQRMEKSKGLMPDVAKYAFLGITSAQKMVDVPTWYGAYYKGFKEFKDDAKAVEYADKILESTQGTSHKYALSAIERNESGFAKIMTTFYSYMNVKLNLLRQSYIGTDFKKPKDIAKFASDMTLLFVADAIATEFLRQGISEALNGDDEEEKSALKYANLIGQSITSTVPGVREIYNSAIGYSAMPAGLGVLDIAGKKGIGVIGKEILKEDEVDWVNVLRGVNNTSAVFSVGGGAQIDIFLGALQKQQEGEEVAPIDFLLKPKK